MYSDVWWRDRVNGCVAASWYDIIYTKDINTVLTLRCNQVPMLLQKPDSNSCYYYYYYQQYKQRGAEAIKCSVTATGFRLAAVVPYVKSSSVVDRQVSGGQNRGPWLHVANQNVNISSTTFRIFGEWVLPLSSLL